MTRFRILTLALAALLLASGASAQQRTPQAVDQTGRTANAAPTAIIIAPAGGGLGKGRPLAEDKGMPLQGKDSITGLACVIGPSATCQLPGPGGGGGGGGAVTAAAGSYAAGAIIQLPNVLGPTLKASSLSVTFATDMLLPGFISPPTINLGTLNGAALASNQATQIAELGGLTEAVPSTDTGSSGLNGRLQRLQQTITALNAKIDTMNTAIALIQTSTATTATNTGDVTTVLPTTPTAGTGGGATSFSFEVAASDNHQTIKNGAGTIYTISGWSKHSAALYLRLYDAGTGFNGCNAATNLIWEGQIPNPGFVFPYGAVGRKFTAGLSVCVTGAYGNTDTTAATASVASVNVGFQ